MDGWYVDTNLSCERMRTILPAAVEAGRLTGTEVKVFWLPTRVND